MYLGLKTDRWFLCFPSLTPGDGNRGYPLPEGQRNLHATFGPMNDSIWKNMLECLFEYVFFTQARILYFYGSVSAKSE